MNRGKTDLMAGVNCRINNGVITPRGSVAEGEFIKLSFCKTVCLAYSRSNIRKNSFCLRAQPKFFGDVLYQNETSLILGPIDQAAQEEMFEIDVRMVTGKTA
jgi:hypothetical protein